MPLTLAEIAVLVLASSVLVVSVLAIGKFLLFPQKRTFRWFTLAALAVVFVSVGVVSYFTEAPVFGYISEVNGNGNVMLEFPHPSAVQPRNWDKWSEYVSTAIYFVVTLFAAVVAYLFSVQGKLKSSVPALQKLLPSRSDAFYNRLDFLLVAIGGSVIGYVFFSPTTARQALSAGMGWVGAVNILSNGKSDG